MKKSELKKLIKEEISKIISERPEQEIGDISGLKSVLNVKPKRGAFGGTWLVGKTKDGKWDAQLMVFKDASQYGILKGRISKLWLKNKETGETVEYDRGWGQKPESKEAKKLANDIIKALK